MKNILLLSLLFIVLKSQSQDLNTCITLYNNKDYSKAIDGLNNYIAKNTKANTNHFKARYYLGKALFDCNKNDPKLVKNSCRTTIDHWKFVMKTDKSKTWLHKIEEDLVWAVQLSYTEPNKKVDHDKEIAFYKEMLVALPDNPVLLFGLGEANDHGNHHDVAFAHYTKALQLYIEKKDTNYKHTAALSAQRIAEDQFFRKNNYDQSLQYARMGLTFEPEIIELQTIEALSVYKSTSKEDGLKKFEAIAAKNPDNAYVKEKYAYLLEHTKPEEAVKQYTEALNTNPDNPRALFFLGQYYTQKGTDIFNAGGNPQEVYENMMKGIDYLEKYRALKPQDKEVTRSLIKMYENLRMADKAEALKKELGE
jgi:tetratricopeptide (TPR) repeat protein